MNRKRVVITGFGAITPLGSSVEQFWSGLLAGHSGIRRITQFDASNFPCQIAGEIPDFEVENYLERKEARRLPRSAQIALAAACQAITAANLPAKMPEPERTAVVVGTAIGGIDSVDENTQILRSKGYSRVSPFAIPAGLPNIPAYAIAHQFQCLGPSATLTTACASSTQAIGEATEWIRRGTVDLAITGGTEAAVRDFAIGGFSAMRALPVNFNEQPEQASRPFDKLREGFIFSEGAGILVLEALEHALARGVRIWGEIAGHAASSDAYHMAAPDPQGTGPARAMRWALQDANLVPAEIGYINAHGTSTQLNDAAETHAIKAVFDRHSYQVPISSTKSMMGHPMGAAGALEAIVCTLTINNGWIHPTINYEVPDPDCDLDYVPNRPRQAHVDAALSNSFGLGGQNACLVIKRYNSVELFRR